MAARSVLFGPAKRLDFIDKFVRAGADIGVLDLEDATVESAKVEAREAVSTLGANRPSLSDMQLFIRVNPLGSVHFADDLDALAASGAHGVIVPKLEADTEVQAVLEALDQVGLSNIALCAGIESIAGVYRAAEICGAGPGMVYFGAEDFITDMGGVRTASNHEVAYARSQVVLAARMARIDAFDQVVADFRDQPRFVREANEARELGYAGKLCIHPDQVAVANQAFTPSNEEIAQARAIVDAADAAAADGSGVVAVDGMMVDAPIITRARAMIDEFGE